MQFNILFILPLLLFFPYGGSQNDVESTERHYPCDQYRRFNCPENDPPTPGVDFWTKNGIVVPLSSPFIEHLRDGRLALVIFVVHSVTSIQCNDYPALRIIGDCEAPTSQPPTVTTQKPTATSSSAPMRDTTTTDLTVPVGNISTTIDVDEDPDARVSPSNATILDDVDSTIKNGLISMGALISVVICVVLVVVTLVVYCKCHGSSYSPGQADPGSSGSDRPDKAEGDGTGRETDVDPSMDTSIDMTGVSDTANTTVTTTVPDDGHPVLTQEIGEDGEEKVYAGVLRQRIPKHSSKRSDGIVEEAPDDQPISLQLFSSAPNDSSHDTETAQEHLPMPAHVDTSINMDSPGNRIHFSLEESFSGESLHQSGAVMDDLPEAESPPIPAGVNTSANVDCPPSDDTIIRSFSQLSMEESLTEVPSMIVHPSTSKPLPLPGAVYA